ncbi:MAG: NAD(P)/FAD-dependent oxidoreductase, partial [Nitrospirota bacterium]|nr:NAD(P)/FAD-dependent oxidoreductase [Nitrospirota bacterium]
KYDAVIIGAGIGGLVCGCYLAKAGMKVLIAEQHHKPGGYCTSFKRKGFTFDAAAHSFGGYREGGMTRRIIKELDIDSAVRIDRSDPSDVIQFPNGTVIFWNDVDRTIAGIIEQFPDEAGQVRNFIYTLLSDSPAFFAGLRGITFKTLLDRFFKDEELKAILAFPLYGNGGLPSYLMSAFTGSKLFSEFILDGGYYPVGGMQVLADQLALRFKEYGGEIHYALEVKQILIKDDAASGVIVEKNRAIASNRVIGACDARTLYCEMIKERNSYETIIDKIENMAPSLSMFVLYLGMNSTYGVANPGTNVWFLPHYNMDTLYRAALERNAENMSEFMVRFSPDGRSVLGFMNAAYGDEAYWKYHKNEMIDSFICRIEQALYPGLSASIVFKDAATPITLHRYTRNHKGAAYGWASTVSQFAQPEIRRPLHPANLYLVGHWSTFAQGIPGVMYTGLDTAKVILKHNSAKIRANGITG